MLLTRRLVCLAAGSVTSAPTIAQSFSPDAATTDSLFQNALGQYAASRVCGDQRTILQIRNSVIRIMNWNDFKRYNLRSVQIFRNNSENFLLEGERRYREQRWISCEQVSRTVQQIDEITRRFP